MQYCLFRKSSHTLFIRKVEAAETQMWGRGIASDSMLVHKNVRNF